MSLLPNTEFAMCMSVFLVYLEGHSVYSDTIPLPLTFVVNVVSQFEILRN